MPLLYCPVASAEPTHIGTRESPSERFRFDLLQDVPNQYHHMLTGGAHVPGLAVGSDCKIRPIHTFPPLMIPLTSNNEAIFPSRWRQDALHKVLQVGILVVPSRDVLLGTPGVSLVRFFSKQKNREFKLKFLKKLFDNNNILCLQEVHGKDEYLQAVQVLAPRSRFFGTFIPGNENAGGSALCIHKDLLLEDAIVTHMTTCQGRDHIVNVQSGRQKSSVNVHFELELTLRQLRERLRPINPHWPSYPNAVGIILGDFNICEPEDGRFNVWIQTFTEGDPRKTAIFHSFSTRS